MPTGTVRRLKTAAEKCIIWLKIQDTRFYVFNINCSVGGGMVKLWQCEICGDPYLGESPPKNCPFCGAHRRYIKDAREARAEIESDHLGISGEGEGQE